MLYAGYIRGAVKYKFFYKDEGKYFLLRAVLLWAYLAHINGDAGNIENTTDDLSNAICQIIIVEALSSTFLSDRMCNNARYFFLLDYDNFVLGNTHNYASIYYAKGVFDDVSCLVIPKIVEVQMVGLPRISITLFDKDIAFGVNPLSIRGANIPSTNTKQVSGALLGDAQLTYRLNVLVLVLALDSGV
ncbi:hypothetical protein [Anaplasma phagocytophilum]|uniref:Uncharacterized protein n=2 Tax=Anaplasma phagocytophilum TaxID=948 RepID=Q2GJQ0_ANAPZ|nr:hypothetical protein [Anaplasma phagocytophilum]KJV60601.1 hypothetical protein APHWEB_1189 [Anaplasma phagocytophilum str. Webster]ABD43915.1 hypothetical protein APH_0824 [Anaplasma phagocytophilum str. HZ]AGR79499.1 hypothetical protein YYU_03830 [Anaplasma phagocytophilum str. HZ2]AGR80748.1 hypothetical protein WSQ_03830 [Anaplasma phagocytophilum str. JM]KJV63203.1 hypothetical protein EPHNCH_1147 [Anaplasma phagocytophilum str. NCH-1]